MNTKFSSVFSVLALAAVTTAFAEPASCPPPEDPAKFTYDAQGSLILTKAAFRRVVDEEVALRRKIAEPRFFKGVSGNLAEIVAALRRNPFGTHDVLVDPNLPNEERAVLVEGWQAFRAYAIQGGVRSSLADLIELYDDKSLYEWTERLARAKAYYTSSTKGRKLLEELARADKAFEYLRVNTPDKLRSGYDFNRYASGEQVTLEYLFYNFGEFGHWCYLDGEMRPSFESALTVLSRYNARTKDSNLESLLKSLDEMGKSWCFMTDLRTKALADARKGRSTSSFAALIEMDETVMDRMELAMSEFRENIKWFQKDGSVAFKLRTGLPCVHLFTYTDVSTDRADGPDYHLLFAKAADYLAATFNSAFREKWRHAIRKK